MKRLLPLVALVATLTLGVTACTGPSAGRTYGDGTHAGADSYEWKREVRYIGPRHIPRTEWVRVPAE